jgi:ribosomal protein S18 acetylase RimI-like enzyme
VPNLGRSLPIGGPYGHAHRLRGQEEGRWLYLVACDPGPVGGCLVQWGGAVDEGVRRQLPDAVEISNLFVAAAARGRGAGRALIEEAERQTRLRGRHMIGVAVGDENLEARRLYERLGYAETGSRYRAEYDYENEQGERLHAVEEGDFLVKQLIAP